MAFIKGLRFFLSLSIVCIIGILITSYPGEVRFEWLGYSVSLPVGLFITCSLVVFGLVNIFINLWKLLWNLPHNYLKNLKKKKIQRANNLLIDGLSAIAAGQNQEAKEVISVACELLPENPLAQFIAAQASHTTGDEEAAIRHYTLMLKDKRTNFLGLRGLITQAKGREDYRLAQEYINKALQIRPDSPWLQEEYLSNTVYLAQKGTFPNLEKNKITKYLTKPRWTRHQAILYWLKIQNNQLLNFSEKEKLHIKIFELAPDLTINVQQLVEYYLHIQAYSKAQKILLNAFKHHPHRILGLLWDSVFNEMEPVDRYRTMEKLIATQEKHPESLISLATSAMRAQLWGQAKEHLDHLLIYGHTRTGCNLMAELMELQYPAQFDLAKEWWQRASNTPSDYEWQCNTCQANFSNWQAVCNHCNTVDQINWQQTSTPHRLVNGDIMQIEPMTGKHALV